MVAGVRDQYSGDCERVQVVDSTGDAGCSVTLPPPLRASPDARDRWRGWPRPLGAGRFGWAWWKSLMRDGSRMSSLFAQDLSSGPYPSQSMRY